MARAKEDSYSIVYHGKTYNRTPYTITIKVVKSQIQDISIIGRANLFVSDLCKNFAAKKPKNIEDVANVIKLEMLKHNEYVKEMAN